MGETTNWSDLMNQAGPEVANQFETIPEGTYDFEVVAAEFKVSGNGNKMWKVQHKILGGTYNNRRVFDNIVLSTSSQGALNFFFARMTVLGLPRTYFNTGPTDEQVANALIGRRFSGKIKHEEYRGEKQERVGAYVKPIEAGAPVGGGATPPMPGGIPAPPAGAAAPAAPPVGTPAAPVSAPAPWDAAPVAQPSPAPAPAAGGVPTPPSLADLPFNNS